MKSKIVTEELLTEIVRDRRQRGERIVSTSGCFDILHAGHVSYLEAARTMGDMLIVMLNSDSSVKLLKGDDRPIVPQEERAAVLAGLEAVSYVCLFADRTPCRLIGILQPDIIVKGRDYEGVHIPEIDVAEAYGGRVAYADMVAGCSSTNIIEKIKGDMKAWK